MKRVIISIAVLLGIFVIFSLAVYLTTFQPAPLEEVEVIAKGEAPLLKSGDTVKILNWNVQYMAGKNYVFWYDLIDESGPDIMPSKEDIDLTFKELVGIIKSEDPDIILLQELHDGARRTYYEDQLERLLELLPGDYRYNCSAFYWRAAYVPIPQIMGSVGMKLAVISKYKIESARRHQLPIMPDNLLFQQFNFKRAILEVNLPVEGGESLVVLNTHLDAFAQGYNTMEEQVEMVDKILKGLDREGKSWLIGGDFNLLPNREAYLRLPEDKRLYYKEETELKRLSDSYLMLPSHSDMAGVDYEKWFTHFSNEPLVKGPNKTIDYFFYSNSLKAIKYYVRQKDTLHISDHLPMIAEFRLGP